GSGGQHPVPVLLVGEVGAVGAAALLHFGGRAGEYALAAATEQAAPWGGEPGYVDQPAPLGVVGVGKRDPFPHRDRRSGRCLLLLHGSTAAASNMNLKGRPKGPLAPGS